MASHFDCLGFNIQNKYEYLDLISHTARNGEPLSTSIGSYLPWQFGNGIELWAQQDTQGTLVGLNPHYRGKTSQIVALEEKIPNAEHNLDGAFRAWVNMEVDHSTGSPEVWGDYPLIFDCPVFGWFQNLSFPLIARVQLAAFACNLEVQNDDEAYEPIDFGPAQFAREFFIPTGTFLDDEDQDPQATAFFGGTVLSSKTLYNMYSKKDFTLATLRTYGMDIDILVARELHQQPLLEGQIVRGNFWLSGTVQEIIETFDGRDSYQLCNLLFQIPVAGTQYQDAEDVLKALTFCDRVSLVREADNPYDSNAIAVYSGRNGKLGYIPRNSNHALARLMDQGVQPPAHVVSKHLEPLPGLSIRVYLPDDVN